MALYSWRGIVCCHRGTPMQTASAFPTTENILQEIKWPLCSRAIKTGATYQSQAPHCTICATVMFSKQIQEQILHGSIGMWMDVSNNLWCHFDFAQKVSMTPVFQFQRNFLLKSCLIRPASEVKEADQWS